MPRNQSEKLPRCHEAWAYHKEVQAALATGDDPNTHRSQLRQKWSGILPEFRHQIAKRRRQLEPPQGLSSYESDIKRNCVAIEMLYRP
jgi:hypothetical protein